MHTENFRTIGKRFLNFVWLSTLLVALVLSPARPSPAQAAPADELPWRRPQILKDIAQGATRLGNVYYLTAVGQTLFFTFFEDVHGRELWKSDGTPAGTLLVKDIYPGNEGESPFSSSPYELTAFGTELFFTVEDETSYAELWKSDGMPDGTVMVVDVDAINNGEKGFYLGELTSTEDTLYFVARKDSPSRNQLWKTDGTTAGTSLVKDFGDATDLSQMVVTTSGKLFFFLTNSSGEKSLWKSDGSENGTVSAGINDLFLSPNYLTVLGDAVYFSAYSTGYAENELWKSDGSAPEPFTDINPSGSSNPRSLTAIGDHIYFSASDGTSGVEPWITDGTTISQIMDIYSGSSDSSPNEFTAVGNAVYFTASDPDHGKEMWMTVGSQTSLVQDVLPGSSSSNISSLIAVGDSLYFTATDGSNGIELWKTNADGTGMVKDINLNGNANPGNLVAAGDTLSFLANDGDGSTLWKSDGTSDGTVMIPSLEASIRSSHGSNFTAAGAWTFFVATDEEGAYSYLWKTNGTAAGTEMVKDSQGNSIQYPRQLTVNGDVLFFTSNDGVHGSELWKTNGTPEGTGLIEDIRGGLDDSDPNSLIVWKGLLYFTAMDGTGTYLWKSDGTPDGTDKVSDQNGVERIAAVEDSLFMKVYDGVNYNYNLWKSDGTPAGTVPVRAVSDDPFTWAYFDTMTAAGNVVYFNGSDPSWTDRLWRSDGTAAGTLALPVDADLQTNGVDYSNLRQIMAIGMNVFFSAADQNDDLVLWKVDETGERVTLVKTGQDTVNEPVYMAAMGDELYFSAKQDGLTRHLWKSDGTPTGTVPVWGGDPNGPVDPMMLTAGADRLYFAADDGEHGYELWATDGRQDGTHLLADTWPGAGPGLNMEMGDMGYSNGFMFLTASDGVGGYEPWVMCRDVAPVAQALSVSGTNGGPIAITLEGSDVDDDTLAFTIVTLPGHGTLSGTAPHLTYTPARTFEGIDSFTYRVNDGYIDSPAVTVEISVLQAEVDVYLPLVRR